MVPQVDPADSLHGLYMQFHNHCTTAKYFVKEPTYCFDNMMCYIWSCHLSLIIVSEEFLSLQETYLVDVD